MGALSNSGKDERGGYSGGQAGDQTGGEWSLIPWYNRPWNCVLRHPDAKVRATLSSLAVRAAQNDNIGYNQGNRTSYWSELQKVGYDPSKITTKCDDDCSAGVCANIKAAGYLCGDTKLQGVPITSTHYMRNALKNAGFQCLTDSKYLNSDANLIAGDVLLNDGAHTAMWTDGNAGSTSGLGSGGSGGSGGNNIQLASLGIGSYEYKDCTVKAGDTIYTIAAKYKCTPALIMFINNLDSIELKAGTKLKIPVSKYVDANPAQGTNPIEKKHTAGILIDHPVIEVKFYTEQGLLAAISTTGLTRETDFDNDIISINTIRDMSQDCPTFNMNLVWRRGWYGKLASNDLIIISMQRPPEAKRAVFIGLIDDIRKVTDFSSGQPQRAVQVTGRGFAKALVNFEVGLVENVSINTYTGFFDKLTDLASLDSYDAIELILKSYIDKAVRYSFADDSHYGDHYQYEGNHHENEMLVDYENYTQYNGSLWNFIKSLSNAPWNETFWEVSDEKATLIHRRTPFNKSDWIELERTVIKDLDIVSDTTGRSDLETYTMFSVTSMLGSEELINMYLPLWYPPFAQKYGIAELRAATVYQDWGGGGGALGDNSGDGESEGSTGSGGGKKATFLGKVAAKFQAAARKHGFNIVSFAIAQACFESGWGTSNDAKTKNNILGIGPHKYYASWDACIEGYYTDTVLGKSNAAKNATTLDAYFNAFHSSGYSGNNNLNADRSYYEELKKIIKANDLTKYDTGLRSRDLSSSVAAGAIDVINNAVNQATAAAGVVKKSDNDTGEDVDADSPGIRIFFEELFNFNIKNNIMANGDIVVKGLAKYKVGERVITESENLEYYVESVSHNFNCYGSWTTQLGVTRGINPEERYTVPWGDYQELTPAMIAALISQTADGAEPIDWTNLPEVEYSIGGAASAGGATGSGGMDTTATTGSVITIPDGLGKEYSYTNYGYFYPKWSKGTNQRKVADLWGQEGKKSNNGIATLKGRYLVATTTTFGQCGDAIDVILENGTTWHCIIADIKSQGDAGCTKWGHSNGKCVIEFEIAGKTTGAVDNDTWSKSSAMRSGTRVAKIRCGSSIL